MSEENEKPKIFELERFTLFSPVENNKRASLAWSIRDEYPRITVFTRSDSGPLKNGIITAPFDLETVTAFLSQLAMVAKGPDNVKVHVTSLWGKRDERGNITGEKELRGDVWFGKDGNGVVWIAVRAPEHPDIQFKITLSEYHNFYDSNNRQMSEAEGSVLRTLAMVEVLKRVFANRCAKWRDTSIPRENTRGRGQQGGGQRGKASSNNNSYSGANFADDDIAF